MWTTGRGSYRSRWIVNCAGLGSGPDCPDAGDQRLYHPSLPGEYFVLDTKVGPYLPLPVYPVPNYRTGGLGIHLTPSLSGNVFVGPSTEYIEDRSDYASTRKVMELLLEDGSKIFPYLKREYFIRNFAGIRPKLTSKGEGGYHDFVMERREEAPNAVNLVGIESPGLTSAVPIARRVVELIREVEELTPNPAFQPFRKGIVAFRGKTPEQQAELIRQTPTMGRLSAAVRMSQRRRCSRR